MEKIMGPSSQESKKIKIVLVYGSLPGIEEIEQFTSLGDEFEVSLASSLSICQYLSQASFFKNLNCIALPDHDQNSTFLPGLENILEEFDVVVVKERLGVYAYQAVKAKWRFKFRLLVLVDNLMPFPAEDIDRMRTVRQEISDAADGFIVQSRMAENTLLIEGIEKERIIKVNPWVAQRSESLKQSRGKACEALGFSAKDFVIAYMGQVEWEEGLLDLAHAVKFLSVSQPAVANRIKIIVCGIGSFAQQFRERIIKLGIDSKFGFVSPSREAHVTIYNAAQAMFVASFPSRDRIDGDPFRLMAAMMNGIPPIAYRTPLVQELIGKHRIDFCPGSVKGLASAIKKACVATGLNNNIIAKNRQTCEKLYSREVAKHQMTSALNRLAVQTPSIEMSSIDHQILEIESKITSKQYLEAVDMIGSVFQVEGLPNHHRANLYRMIGDCFTKLGDRESGKQSYQQAIELDPFYAKAYIGLGTVAMTSSRYDMAVIHFQKAVALSPSDEMANFGLGLAFQGMDEFKEASRWIVKALEINPVNVVAIYSLVKIVAETGGYQVAEKVLRSYLVHHPHDFNMLFTLAGLLYQMGNYSESIEMVEKIISVDPMDARAQGLLKQARRAISNNSGATTGS
jgi:Flp pilus assembly protein TadD